MTHMRRCTSTLTAAVCLLLLIAGCGIAEPR